MRDLPEIELNLKAPEKFGNVAEKLKEDERRTLATDVMELISVDETSMGPWLGKAKGYLDKIEDDRGEAPQDGEAEGAGEEAPPSTEMTLSAVIQFSARAGDAILGEPDLVRASEEGAQPLASWVSSQLRTKDPNWVLDTDPLVIHMAVTGLAWRKRDFDDIDRVFHSHFLPCTDVIINKNVRSVERAPRITHQFERYPYEIERSIQRRKWVDYEPVFLDSDPQAPKRFYETDMWLDLDGDGIVEPWTLTISRDDQAEVVRIRPRWAAKTVVDTPDMLVFNPTHRFYPYIFLPSPDGTFFPMGFGKLLDRTESSADNLLASITDTAKSEAENGGILAGGGFGLPDKIELKGNRIQTVNTEGAPLASRFSAFPIKSVSPGSVATLEKLLTLGDRLAGTLNLMQNAPASMTATLAKGIIDTGTQVQSAVHRRVVTSLTRETRMFVAMADAYDMLPENVQGSQAEGIAVTADPQLATEMQRSALAGIYMELLVQAAKGVPWKMKTLQMRLGQVLRLPNPEELIGEPPAAPEASPWEKMQGMLGVMKQKSENMKVTGLVAQQLTQALKNMVEASGGMLNNQAALLTMAQLEDAVHRMMQESGADASQQSGGMAPQPGNAGAVSLPAPAPGGGGKPILDGGAGGPGGAGPGGAG